MSKNIKFTILLSEKENEMLEVYRKENYLDNRSASIRHLINSKLERNDKNESNESNK